MPTRRFRTAVRAPVNLESPGANPSGRTADLARSPGRPTCRPGRTRTPDMGSLRPDGEEKALM
jgi:hypothetical protein